jgi:hypothetical protein
MTAPFLRTDSPALPDEIDELPAGLDPMVTPIIAAHFFNIGPLANAPLQAIARVDERAAA